MFSNELTLKHYRKKLKKILEYYFSINSNESYYQGFNDIVAGILIIGFENEEILYYLQKLKNRYFDILLNPETFTNFLLKFLEKIEKKVINLSSYKINKDILSTLIFTKANKWCLTWFSHDYFSPKKLEAIILIWSIILPNPPEYLFYFICYVS